MKIRMTFDVFEVRSEEWEIEVTDDACFLYIAEWLNGHEGVPDIDSLPYAVSMAQMTESEHMDTTSMELVKLQVIKEIK